MSYTVGSLFAGIGGIDLGFERAGFKTVWQVECNEYCRKVLANNFPHADRSITDVRYAGSHNLKPVDVIVGGFPCQDISNAGLRAGIDGERSGLWSEYARIIRELRPKHVLVENVAALLGRGMGRVLGDLAEVGYDAEWRIISAADVGAMHLRERLWVVAYPMYSRRSTESWEQQNKWPAVVDSSGSRTMAHTSQFSERKQANQTNAFTVGGQAWDEPSDCGEYVSDPKSSRCQRGHVPAGFGAERERAPNIVRRGEGMDKVSNSNILTKVWAAISRGECSNWLPEPNVGRVANGVPKRVDRLRGLGNAVVPEIPYQIARRIKQALETA